MEAAVSRHQAVALSAPRESLEAAYPPANPRFELQLAPAHDTPTATLQSVDVRPRERSETATRVVNVTIALIGLVAASPLMVVVALLVRLTSRRPPPSSVMASGPVAVPKTLSLVPPSDPAVTIVFPP